MYLWYLLEVCVCVCMCVCVCVCVCAYIFLLYYMGWFPWFATICAILKKWKTRKEEFLHF